MVHRQTDVPVRSLFLSGETRLPCVVCGARRSSRPLRPPGSAGGEGPGQHRPVPLPRRFRRPAAHGRPRPPGPVCRRVLRGGGAEPGLRGAVRRLQQHHGQGARGPAGRGGAAGPAAEPRGGNHGARSWAARGSSRGWSWVLGLSSHVPSGQKTAGRSWAVTAGTVTPRSLLSPLACPAVTFSCAWKTKNRLLLWNPHCNVGTLCRFFTFLCVEWGDPSCGGGSLSFSEATSGALSNCGPAGFSFWPH